MISSKRIQNAYVNLYRCLRNYLWDFSAVEDIVDLEISSYQSFPDLDIVRKHLSAVRYNAINIISEDDELKDAFDDFASILDEGDTTYIKIDVMKEVVDV